MSLSLFLKFSIEIVIERDGMMFWLKDIQLNMKKQINILKIFNELLQLPVIFIDKKLPEFCLDVALCFYLKFIEYLYLQN